MILDELTQLNKYVKVHPRFEVAFAYILDTNFDNMPEGKYEVDGKNIIAIIGAVTALVAATIPIKAKKQTSTK